MKGSFWGQYRENVFTYITNLLQGDLGQTIFEQPVLYEVGEYVLRSLLLISIALIISLPLGIAKGVFNFRHAIERPIYWEMEPPL